LHENLISLISLRESRPAGTSLIIFDADFRPNEDEKSSDRSRNGRTARTN